VSTTCTVPDAVHGEMADRFGERFTFEVAAGTFSPRSERDEDVAAHLVSIGLASAGRKLKEGS